MAKILLEEAKLNPAFRQKYLNQIDLGPMRQYVSEILYQPNQARNVPRAAAASFSNLAHSLLLKYHPSQIVVYPSLFEKQPYNDNDDNILSAIRDHEGTHAKQKFYQPRLYVGHQFAFCRPTKKIRAILEIRAYQYQKFIAASEKLQISEGLRSLIEERIAMYRNLLAQVKQERA